MNGDVSTKAAIVLTLKDFDDRELAAFNNAIQEFGWVSPQNLSYDKARNLSLIEEDGTPCDHLELLRTASAYEVNKRTGEGRFV